MSALTEFLLARIAEDEEVARGAVRWSEGASQWADDGEPDWQHIARWDPARVLAECDAKRRIVARQPRLSAPDDVRDVWWDLVALLAVPYADHEDFQEEWRV